MAYGKITSSSGRKLSLSPDGWINNEGENLNAAPGGNWLNTLVSADNTGHSPALREFSAQFDKEGRDQSWMRNATAEATDRAAQNALAQMNGMYQSLQAQVAPQQKNAPAGYRFTQNGNLEPIPGGPADIKLTKESLQGRADADAVLSLADEAKTVLPKAHGSGVGTAVGGVANFFGIDNDKNKADAQLKVIAGGLVSKMPKMSGPQSDKDVQLYREMAGQVGDSTLPIEVRQAALNQVKAINSKYATPQAQPVQQSGGMQTGQVVDGYKFLGGNPADKTRWMKVQ